MFERGDRVNLVKIDSFMGSKKPDAEDPLIGTKYFCSGTVELVRKNGIFNDGGVAVYYVMWDNGSGPVRYLERHLALIPESPDDLNERFLTQMHGIKTF